ncbi:NUDIX domain-containing protein [bacterium]|nr:NUDIX domain-containing protein [bacterium]
MSKKDISERPRLLLINRAIVLGKDKILLIQRSSKDLYKPLQWEVPGGKLDKGQDIADALEREVMEETGLMVLPVNRVAYYNSGILPVGKYKGLTYVQLFGVTKKIAGTVKLSAEHDSYVWVSVNKALKDYDLTEETRKALIILDKTISLSFK